MLWTSYPSSEIKYFARSRYSRPVENLYTPHPYRKGLDDREFAPAGRRFRNAPCARPVHAIIYNQMVAHPSLTDAELDRIFHAFADATRRDIVSRVLACEPASISTLAARYDMSFAAVQKHVAVLEGAGLVTKERQGRERIVRGNPERIARARELLVRLESLWRERFSQLDAVLGDPKSLE
jgi:DNA-binding transcriptional ArsR family regulator